MTPRVRRYAEEIGFWHGIEADRLLSRERRPLVMRARGDLIRRLRGDHFSSPQIGRWLKRDHTTILYYLNRRRDA